MRAAIAFILGFIFFVVMMALAKADEPVCQTADNVRMTIDENMQGKGISGEYYVIKFTNGRSAAMVVAMKGGAILSPILFIPFNEKGCQEGNAAAFEGKNYQSFVEGIQNPRKDLIISYTLTRIGGRSASDA